MNKEVFFGITTLTGLKQTFHMMQRCFCFCNIENPELPLSGWGFFLGLWMVQNAAAQVLTRSLKCECTVLILQSIKKQYVKQPSPLT